MVCHVSGLLCCITTTGPLLHVPWGSTTPTHCHMQVVELLYDWKKGQKMSLSILNDLIIHFIHFFIFFFHIYIYNFILRGFLKMLLQNNSFFL